MVLNATFNNISVISWQLIYLDFVYLNNHIYYKYIICLFALRHWVLCITVGIKDLTFSSVDNLIKIRSLISLPCQICHI